MPAKRIDLDTLTGENAKVLAELSVDPTTPDSLRVQIMTSLIAGMTDSNFFATMFKENLSEGECPECGHLNHWLIPEEELNRMGFVTHEADERVPRMTTMEDCEKWQEACKKKKVTI
jgi:hypothetical protein